VAPLSNLGKTGNIGDKVTVLFPSLSLLKSNKFPYQWTSHFNPLPLKSDPWIRLCLLVHRNFLRTNSGLGLNIF